MSSTARTLLITFLVCLAPTPSLAAASGDDVLKACIAGHLTGHYSAADYASALATMPSDVKEYTDCPQQIQAAQLRDAAGAARAAAVARTSSGSGSGSGSSGAGASPVLSGAVDAASRPVTKPLSTTPTRTYVTGADDSSDGRTAVNMLSALPTGGGDGPSAGSGSGHGLPVIPIVIAFAAIALSGARALQWWGDRPDTDAAQSGEQAGAGAA